MPALAATDAEQLLRFVAEAESVAIAEWSGAEAEKESA